jgi:hypothetical protein
VRKSIPIGQAYENSSNEPAPVVASNVVPVNYKTKQQ